MYTYPALVRQTDKLFTKICYDLCFWRDRYHDCECIIGGDFNVDIDGGDVLASRIVDLVSRP